MNTITKKWEGFEYPQQGGTGENTPFAKQSKLKERDNDNGHETLVKYNFGAVDLMLIHKKSVSKVLLYSFKVKELAF